MEKAPILYSVPIGDPKPGQTSIYRNPQSKDALSSIPPNIGSFVDLWDILVKKFQDQKLMEDIKFPQAFQSAKKVGSWLLSHGHNLFYLYCKNSIEWTISDIATMNYGLVNVPLYETLGAEAIDYILEATEGTAICTVKHLVPNIVNLLSKNKRNIKEAIIFGQELTPEEKKSLEDIGLKVTNFSELLGHNQILQRPKLNLDNPISYIYTSGTTGVPKGVVITHRMALSQFYGIDASAYTTEAVQLSVLPIAHIFQRMVNWICMFKGTNIRYSKHPITQLTKDLAEIRPTVIPLVPRLLNRFYPVMKALEEKEGNYEKIRQIFGGRLKHTGTGSGPITKQKLIFFKKALGCKIGEGYGQTETTAYAFGTHDDEEQFGHVGGPSRVIEFKLIDVPDMNYLTTTNPPRGQICVRGENIFKEYFKNPEMTKATIDAQGWNHTGDIGEILPNGALKIIDRCKNIFKLQQGEYVAPEKVENIYARCNDYVTEAFVDGISLQRYCVAIIHPNMENLPVIAKRLGIEESDPVKLCENKQINELIFNEITKQGKTDGLNGFEMAKKIKLWPKPFITMGILTITMKLQRSKARKVFEEQIKKLYEQQ